MALLKICKNNTKHEQNLIFIEPKRDMNRSNFITRICDFFRARVSKIFFPTQYFTKQLISIIKNSAQQVVRTKCGFEKVTFRNLEDSPFRQKRKHKIAKTEFAYGWTEIPSKGRIIGKILDPENIRLAWAKARWDSYREDIPMLFESKLFEGNIDEMQFFEANLDNIACILAHPSERTLKLRRIPYQIPKRKGKLRTRTITSLEEKIISQAVLNIIGPLIEAEFDKLGEKGETQDGVSFGYRLNCRDKKIHPSEWIFRPPIYRYKKRIQNLSDRIESAPDDSVVLLTDIEKFYDYTSRGIIILLKGYVK